MKTLFNPLSKDFSITYDINENKSPVEFKIRALDFGEFPDPVAENMIKHLSDEVMHTRGIKLNAEDDLKEIREEIEVKYG